MLSFSRATDGTPSYTLSFVTRTATHAPVRFVA
jgi:hypothetical protein